LDCSIFIFFYFFFATCFVFFITHFTSCEVSTRTRGSAEAALAKAAPVPLHLMRAISAYGGAWCCSLRR
jgi:hypothetical protein